MRYHIFRNPGPYGCISPSLSNQDFALNPASRACFRISHPHAPMIIVVSWAFVVNKQAANCNGCTLCATVILCVQRSYYVCNGRTLCFASSPDDIYKTLHLTSSVPSMTYMNPGDKVAHPKAGVMSKTCRSQEE